MRTMRELIVISMTSNFETLRSLFKSPNFLSNVKPGEFMDNRGILTLQVGTFLSLLILTWSVTGQGERRNYEVMELRSGDVDPSVFMTALTPSFNKPPGSRSLSASESCAKFHQQKSRGIAFEPVTPKVAMSVEFESDSSELSKEAKRQLDGLGQALESLSTSCFWVEGHTDDLNTESYNLALSERRAAAVASYLSSHFDVDRDQLIDQGLGESSPLVESTTAEARQRNRRVQISNLGYQSADGDS